MLAVVHQAMRCSTQGPALASCQLCLWCLSQRHCRDQAFQQRGVGQEGWPHLAVGSCHHQPRRMVELQQRQQDQEGRSGEAQREG